MFGQGQVRDKQGNGVGTRTIRLDMGPVMQAAKTAGLGAHYNLAARALALGATRFNPRASDRLPLLAASAT